MNYTTIYTTIQAHLKFMSIVATQSDMSDKRIDEVKHKKNVTFSADTKKYDSIHPILAVYIKLVNHYCMIGGMKNAEELLNYLIPLHLQLKTEEVDISFIALYDEIEKHVIDLIERIKNKCEFIESFIKLQKEVSVYKMRASSRLRNKPAITASVTPTIPTFSSLSSHTERPAETTETTETGTEYHIAEEYETFRALVSSLGYDMETIQTELTPTDDTLIL